MSEWQCCFHSRESSHPPYKEINFCSHQKKKKGVGPLSGTFTYRSGQRKALGLICHNEDGRGESGGESPANTSFGNGNQSPELLFIIHEQSPNLWAYQLFSFIKIWTLTYHISWRSTKY